MIADLAWRMRLTDRERAVRPAVPDRVSGGAVARAGHPGRRAAPAGAAGPAAAGAGPMIPRWSPGQWLLRVVDRADPARARPRRDPGRRPPPASSSSSSCWCWPLLFALFPASQAGVLVLLMPVVWWAAASRRPAAPDVPGGRCRSARLPRRGAAGVVRAGPAAAGPGPGPAVGPRGRWCCCSPCRSCGRWRPCWPGSGSGPRCGWPAWRSPASARSCRHVVFGERPQAPEARRAVVGPL